MRILELKVLIMQKSSSLYHHSVTISYTLIPTVVKYFTLYEIKPGFLFYLLRLINYNLLSQSILYKCTIDCK